MHEAITRPSLHAAKLLQRVGNHAAFGFDRLAREQDDSRHVDELGFVMGGRSLGPAVSTDGAEAVR